MTRADCRELVAVLWAKGLKITTVRGITRTLSTLLSQAVEDEKLPANPALRMGKHLRRGDEPETVIQPLSVAEVAHLVPVAERHFGRWYPWVLCALRTGLRLGELLALQQDALVSQRASVQTRLKNLVAAVENGSASPALLRAIQEREQEIARLDAELAALMQPTDEHRLAVLPTWVRQQFEDVASLLGEVPERARLEFQRLGLRFNLFPVYDVPAGERPFLRAVGEGRFEHLAGPDAAFLTAGRSRVQPAGSRKFVVDLPAGRLGRTSRRMAG